MNDLIKALQIISSYMVEDVYAPTHCEHDILYLHVGLDKHQISEADLAELDKLGFSWNDEFDCFYSFRFGSC